MSRPLTHPSPLGTSPSTSTIGVGIGAGRSSPANARRPLPTPPRPSPITLSSPLANPSGGIGGSGVAPSIPAKRQREPSDASASKPSNVAAPVPATATGEAARLRESAKKAKLSPGQAWVADKVEQMMKQYKAAVLAATVILQFQADAKAIGYKPPAIPRRLSTALEYAWRNYESLRQHLEWYLARNAEYALDPEKFARPIKQQPTPLPPPPSQIPTATTLPTPPTPAMVAQHALALTPGVPAASPIALSSASFLAHTTPTSMPPPTPPTHATAMLNNPHYTSNLSTSVSGPVSGPSNGGNSNNTTQVSFSDTLLFPDTSEIDLSALGMDEISAIINGTSNTGTGRDGIGATGQGGISGSLSALGFSNSPGVSAPITGGTGTGGSGGTGGTPGPTDGLTPNTRKLFASLEASASASATGLSSGPGFGQNSQNMSALTGSSSSQDQGQQSQQPVAPPPPQDTFDFNFDTSDVDLSGIDMAALEGLFGDDMELGSGMASMSSNAVASGSGGGNNGGDGGSELDLSSLLDSAPVEIPQQQQQQPPQQQQSQQQQPQQQQPQQQQQQDLQLGQLGQGQQDQQTQQSVQLPQIQQQQLQQQQQPPVIAPADPVPPPAPAVVSVPEPIVDFDPSEMGEINFDDFNFGDSMPNVDGDEFASLFAEFK